MKSRAALQLALLPLFVAAVCLVPPSATAQSMAKVLEELLNPAAEEAKPEPTAQEQLAWAKEQVKAAQASLERYRSPEFAARIERLGLPPTRQNEFTRAAQDQVNSWQAAVATLDAIVLQETVSAADTPAPVPVPTDSRQAAELESRLDRIKEQTLKLGYEADTLRSMDSRMTQARNLLRQELADALQEQKESASPEALGMADLRVGLVKEKIAAADAAIFYSRWQQYFLGRQTAALAAEKPLVQAALEKSGLHRALDRGRAKLEVEAIRKKISEMEKAVAAGVEEAARRSEEFKRFGEKLQAGAGEGNPLPEADRQALQVRGQVLEAQNSLAAILRAKLAALEIEEKLWQRVADLPPAWTLEDLRATREETEDDAAALEAFLARIDGRLSGLRAQAESVQKELRQPGIAPAHKKNLQELEKINAQVLEQTLGIKKDALDIKSFQEKMLVEIEEQIAALREKQTLRAILADIRAVFERVWGFEITQAGGNPLTLGVLVTAAAAVALAVFLSRFFSRKFAEAAVRRFNLPPAQHHLVQTLALYALAVFFALGILQWLNIPLTIFAFLGGALVVGVGFGSQNLINNFISGILLLLEQKIKVGDIVEVDGNFGAVVNLGSRCSSIRRFDGVEVLVPNSSLLEKNVVNWTLTDPQHRYEIVVGFAYGSDLDLVFQMLHDALEAQPEILKDPAPEVAFESFGDSALVFHIYYWLLVGQHNARQVGSEIRRRIDRLCRERGIEIAFPQRDLRIRSSEPIPVVLGHRRPGDSPCK